MVKIPDIYISRKAKIVAQFNDVLESHITDFMAGRVDKMYDLKEIADLIFLHPVHLSKVIKMETGHHAFFFEQRILLEAKKLFADKSLPIGRLLI